VVRVYVCSISAYLMLLIIFLVLVGDIEIIRLFGVLLVWSIVVVDAPYFSHSNVVVIVVIIIFLFSMFQNNSLLVRRMYRLNLEQILRVTILSLLLAFSL
jgi:hypothetical protein